MGALGILFGQQKVVINDQNSGLGGDLNSLSGVLRQTIGGLAGIVIDATIREEHQTEAISTENPVEDGADVTDHVRLKNAQLTIDGVISDTPLGYAIIGNIQNVVRTVSTLFGKSARSVDAYNDLLELQKSRQPFTVTTGLKRYKNMILSSLSVPRDYSTGRAIHFTAVFKEIRIVASKSGALSLSSSVADAGSKTKDLGNKITPAAEAGNKVTTESENSSSTLYNILN